MAGGNNYYFFHRRLDIASSRCVVYTIAHTRTNIALFKRPTLSPLDGATELPSDEPHSVARSMARRY